MLVLTVVVLLSGAAAGRTMTAYSLLPGSCAALAAAALASDMTPGGIAWRALALVGALQLGFVVGLTSGRMTSELERRVVDKVRSDAVFVRTGRRFFRGRLRGGAKSGV